MRSRAVVLRSLDAGLTVERLERPAPREGAMVVEVEPGGICGTDLHLRQGHLPMPTPIVLGHEAVGRVGALGPGVTVDSLGQPLRPGDRVAWASSIACGRCCWCLH